MRPPKVYSIDFHMIPSKKIDMHAFVIIETLRLNGHLAFLVGGSVRDLLLNVRPKDFDIATSAKPEEIKKVFYKKCILIGKRFRLAHVRFGKKIIEPCSGKRWQNLQQSHIQKRQQEREMEEKFATKKR